MNEPRRLPLPSPATAISLLALFVALGGTGYAVSRIDGDRLEPRSVAGKKLRRDTVTGAEVRESKLRTVPNARRLGGEPKSAFLRPCHMGTVHGFVRVKGAADFPSTFVDTLDRVELPFHCGGGKVYARRVGEGVYRVHFDPPVGALAFANGEGGAFASTLGVDDASAPGSEPNAFEVRVRGGDGQPRPTDTGFSLMVP